MASPLALPIDDLLVGQNCPEGRTPIYGHLGLVGQTTLKELGENPLGPPENKGRFEGQGQIPGPKDRYRAPGIIKGQIPGPRVRYRASCIIKGQIPGPRYHQRSDTGPQVSSRHVSLDLLHRGNRELNTSYGGGQDDAHSSCLPLT